MNIYSSSGGNVFDVIEVKVWVLSFEKLDAEHELALNVLRVPTGDEGLAMAVFLVALYSGGGACCAAGMF